MRELYLDDRGLKMTRLTDPAGPPGATASPFRGADARERAIDAGDSGEFAADAIPTTLTPASPMPPPSPIMPSAVQSAEQIRKSLEGRQVCPFCGTADETGDAGGPCPRCTMENTPATRKATKERIGPWYVLQSRNPAAPGMRFETLLSFVRKGRVKPRSVVRGPTTHQLWRFAAQVKGLSREFGVCYSCGDSVDPDTASCPHCGRDQVPPPNPDALLESSPDAQSAPPVWTADFNDNDEPVTAGPAKPPPAREPRLDEDLGATGAGTLTGDAAEDIVIPALSASDESLAGFRVTAPPDDPIAGAAAVAPASPVVPQPAAPTPPTVAPAAAAPAPAPTATPPRRSPAPVPAAAPQPARPVPVPPRATTTPPPQSPRRGTPTDGDGAGGFLSPKDLAAAFKLNFDPRATYGAPAGHGAIPADLAAEADDFFERGRAPAPPRPRRKRRWFRKVFLLLLIVAAGFAGLMYADPVFRVRAQRWGWDRWVWFRDNVLSSSDIDLDTNQPVPPKGGAKRPPAPKKQQETPADGGEKSGTPSPDAQKDVDEVTDLVVPGVNSGATARTPTGAATARATDDAVRGTQASAGRQQPQAAKTDPWADAPTAAQANAPAPTVESVPPKVQLRGGATRPATAPAPPGFAEDMRPGGDKPSDKDAATAGASTTGSANKAPAPAPPAAPDPKQQEQEMWRLYRAGLDAEGRGDYAAAVRDYEQIKQKLPKSVWPGNLDVRLNLARKQLESKKSQ